MPIINPWLIYLVGISGEVSTILCFISIPAMVTYLVISFLDFIDGELVEDCLGKNCRKRTKTLKWIAIISTVLYALFPSKEIMVAMFVADNVTYENLEIVGETIKDSVDYIFEKVNNE